MKYEDFAWDKLSSLNVNFIGSFSMPSRFALTAPQVVINSASREILLIDPHRAGTWETWMFPYASLILTTAEIATKCKQRQIDQVDVLNLSEKSTFRQLSLALKQLREIFEDDYQSAIRTGINNILPQLQGGWSGTVFYENYSLKFSKTSMSYTAYDFDYYINSVEDVDLTIPHTWIRPDLLKKCLASNHLFEGRTVSSNVVESLPAILEYLNEKWPRE